MKTLVPYERISQSSNALCPPSVPVSSSRRASLVCFVATCTSETRKRQALSPCLQALLNIVSAPVCKLSAAVSNVERIAPQFFSMASLAPPALSNNNLSLASWNSIGSSIGYLSNKLSRLSSLVTGSTDCHPESPKAPPEDESCSFTDDNEDDDSNFCYVGTFVHKQRDFLLVNTPQICVLDYESEFEIQESDDESVGSMNSLSDFDPSSLLVWFFFFLLRSFWFGMFSQSTPHSYEDAHFGYDIGQVVLVIVGSEWCEGEIISINSDGNYGVRLFGENFVRNVWASFVREI